ncbi:MAG: DUF3788 family protein [Bacteroides sp.]|jgi:hypothetical protein|nr:DUF3788 family protein [Bacteroides sp.]
METLLLREPGVRPTAEVLLNALGDSYPTYENLMETLAGPEFGLVPHWSYYKDGKAWLCKIVFGKKTVCWLSVWDGFFKTAFYFNEKTAPGVFELNLSASLKETFRQTKPSGRMIPLVFNIQDKLQLPELLEVARYKKSLK